MAKFVTLINEIKAKKGESQRAVFKSTNLEITITGKHCQNKIQNGGRSRTVELSGDNANIKSVLDTKQNEWTNVDQKAKKSSKPAVNTEPNAFQILDVEESSSGNDQNSKEANHPKGSSKDSTRRRKLPKFEGKGLREDPSNNVVTMKESTTKQSQEKAVLVICDSIW
jgi:hypothetical protein